MCVDGVGPINNRTSPDKLHIFVPPLKKKINVTLDVTCVT